MNALVLTIYFLVLSCWLAQAGKIQSLDGKTYEGEVSFDSQSNRLSVAMSDSVTAKVAFSNVLSASFGSGAASMADFGPLAEGWSSLSVGDVSITGSAGQAKGVFALKVAASDVGEKFDSFHYVYHRASGECEIVARVTSIDGADRLSKAGVMIRETLQPGSRFALVSLTGGGAVSFQHRTEAGQKSLDRPSGEATLPYWLKLVKKSKTFIAYRSTDGQKWEVAGTATVNFGDTFFLGLVVTSHSGFALSTATLDQVRLTVNGLRGEYFADEEFKNLKLTRVDPKLDFGWGVGSPDPLLPNDHFSIRWTGQVEPRYSQNYVFHVDADNSAQLWIEGNAIQPVAFKKEGNKTAPSVPLEAGKRYDLKMEFREGDGSASVRLGWSSPSQGKELIPASRLFCTVEASASGSPMAQSTWTNAIVPAKGVILRGGTFVAGHVKSVDATGLKFSYRGEKEFPISMPNVARIILRLPQRGSPVNPGTTSTGVLLTSGDFFEGDIKHLDGWSVKVSSVLFGLKQFNFHEVSAILLSDALIKPARFELHTADGSVFKANSISVEKEDLLIDEQTLGLFRIPQLAVVELLPGTKPKARVGRKL